MPPIVFTLLQALFLLLLYVFVARAVRAVLRDVRPEGAGESPARPAQRTTGSGAKRSRPRARPTELVVHIPGARPAVVPLDGREVVFGRSEEASVALPDPYASDLHARVYSDGGDWLVADLGSTNGTYLNQVKVTSPTPIAAGDQVAIGKTIVEVRR